MREKRSVAALKAAGYRQARKREKTKRLDDLVELTHYTRRHARRLLSQHGKKVWVKPKTTVVGNVNKRSQRVRRRIYDDEVLAVLIKIWKMMDYLCGKRLQPVLAEIVTVLERHNELSCPPETRAKLLKISAATIDWLLRPERRKYELRQFRKNSPKAEMVLDSVKELFQSEQPIYVQIAQDFDKETYEIDLYNYNNGQATSLSSFKKPPEANGLEANSFQDPVVLDLALYELEKQKQQAIASKNTKVVMNLDPLIKKIKERKTAADNIRSWNLDRLRETFEKNKTASQEEADEILNSLVGLQKKHRDFLSGKKPPKESQANNSHSNSTSMILRPVSQKPSSR